MPRYDLLAKHEEEEIERAHQENIREPYVTHNRDAVWVGDRIASVIENPTPLSNLFVRMVQQMGIEMDRFGSSTGMLGEV